MKASQVNPAWLKGACDVTRLRPDDVDEVIVSDGGACSIVARGEVFPVGYVGNEAAIAKPAEVKTK